MVAPELYPFSTQDGQAIPVEIIKPTKLIWWSLIKNVAKIVTIPAGMNTAYALSSGDCLFRVGTPNFTSNTQDTVMDNTMFIPANTIITVALIPGAASFWPLISGNIYLSAIQQWASLSQSLQSRTQ